jgi:hypothetical protein
VRKIIERKNRQDKFRIRERAAKLDITLADLCREASTITGYKFPPTLFSKAISGKYDRPSADRTLEVADKLLKNLENESK